MIQIPFFGIDRQYASLREELLDAVDLVYRSGQVLDGNYTKTFEDVMAARCNRTWAVALNSCTQAIIMALTAVLDRDGIGRNVIIPTVSFAATLNSVLMARADPVFCDVDDQGLLDLNRLAFNPDAHNINTLMYVNLFGNMVDYDRINVVTEFFNNSNMTIIEDAAQSFGASYKGIPSGKLGDVSVLSFDPTKNLPNYGSGGMLLTDNFAVYQLVRNLRDNGKEDGHVIAGTNSKMSESDCAQMIVKLKYFDQWQRRRTEIANYYTDQFKNYVRVSEVSPDVVHAWHKYPIWLERLPRHNVRMLLGEMGIDTRVHYYTPLNQLGCNPYNSFLQAQGDYPMGETHARTELSLPIYPELTDAEVEYIAESVVTSISD